MSTDNALYLVEKLLVDRLLAALATITPAIPSTRVKLPNAPLTTPNNLSWLRVNSPVNNGPIESEVSGGDAAGCYEINQGFWIVSVFFPKGTGSQAALAYAHKLKELYNGVITGDIVILSVVESPTPEPESSPWYGVNVQVNFTFEGYTS